MEQRNAEHQTDEAGIHDDGVATSNTAQDAGAAISLTRQQQQQQQQQQQSNTEPRCSTIRRKTSRARLCYFNDMLSDNSISAAQCDTVRRRRQKSASMSQRGGAGLAADETDSGIALTPEWELLPQSWSRADDPRTAAAYVGNRRMQPVSGGQLQTPPLKVPSASQWGEAFDTMVAQLRCKLPVSASEAINFDDGCARVAIGDTELHVEAHDPYFGGSGGSSDNGLCSENADGVFRGGDDVLRTVATHDCGGKHLWTGGGGSVGSESGSCCSQCCAAVQCSCGRSSASSNGSENGGGTCGGAAAAGSAAGCQTTAVAFRDIIYRRTGRSLTIDIAPSIVKTASNNDVWIKLRNDQEESSSSKKNGSGYSSSRRVAQPLPQRTAPHAAVQDASNRKKEKGSDVRAADPGSGRWQKLRKLFTMKVNKKERSQGHVRVMLKNGGGHLD